MDFFYAFYGTLRVGMENYYLFRSGMEHLETTMLMGFTLYSLGEYPYAVKTQLSSDVIVVDLFRISAVVQQEIHKIELDAGYYQDYVEVKGQSYGIYLFKEPQKGDPRIIS